MHFFSREIAKKEEEDYAGWKDKSQLVASPWQAQQVNGSGV